MTMLTGITAHHLSRHGWESQRSTPVSQRNLLKPRHGRAHPVRAQLQELQATTLWRNMAPHLTAGHGATGAVITVATAHALRQVYEALPPSLQQRITLQVAKTWPYTAAAALAGAALISGEESWHAWPAGHYAVGAATLAFATPCGLAAVQIITSHWGSPLPALTAPLGWSIRHTSTFGGAAMACTGLGLARASLGFATTCHPWAIFLALGAISATTGGLEMVGRDQNIAPLKRCFSGPARTLADGLNAVLQSDQAWASLGLALALVSAASACNGIGFLAQPHSSPLDAWGALQVTTAEFIGTLGLGLVDRALRPERKATQVLNEYAALLASIATTSWATALGKYAMADMWKDGLTGLNTGGLSAAAILVSMGIGTIMRQFSTHPQDVEECINRCVAASASGCFGAWTLLLSGRMMSTLGVAQQEPITQTVSAVAAMSMLIVLTAALGLTTLGNAAHQPWMHGHAKAMGNFALDRAGDAAGFTARRPWWVLGFFAVAYCANMT